MQVRLVFMIFLLTLVGNAQAQSGGNVDVNINIIGPQEALDFLHAQRSAQYMAMSALMQGKAQFTVFDKGDMTPVLTIEQRFAMAIAPVVVGEEMNGVMSPKGTYTYFYNGQWMACVWPEGIKPRRYPIGVCTFMDRPDST